MSSSAIQHVVMFFGWRKSRYAASWWHSSALPDGGFQIMLSWISRSPGRPASAAPNSALRARERRRGERAVGLPDVAELARAVGRRGRRVVVDLVGREAGLPLVLEAAVEALAHALDLVVAQPVLDDEEAVAPIGVDLCVAVCVARVGMRRCRRGCRRRSRGRHGRRRCERVDVTPAAGAISMPSAPRSSVAGRVPDARTARKVSGDAAAARRRQRSCMTSAGRRARGRRS